MAADYMEFFLDAYRMGVGAGEKKRIALLRNATLCYCNAKRLVPISREELRERGDPFSCPWRTPLMAEGIMMESMDDGKTAAEAFNAAFGGEVADCAWRPMTADEQAAPGMQLALMSQAMEIFGPSAVVKAIAADRGLDILRAAR